MTVTAHELKRSHVVVNGNSPKLAARFAKEALTFDDVLLVPGYTEKLPSEIDISVHLHERLHL